MLLQFKILRSMISLSFMFYKIPIKVSLFNFFTTPYLVLIHMYSLYLSTKLFKIQNCLNLCLGFYFYMVMTCWLKTKINIFPIDKPHSSLVLIKCYRIMTKQFIGA